MSATTGTRMQKKTPTVSQLAFFGPSDRIRTCGILLPKQVRYHLRYTRIWQYEPV